MTILDLKTTLGAMVVLAPLLLAALLGIAALAKLRLREKIINHLVQTAIVTGLLASIVMLGWMLVDGTRHVVIAGGDWIDIPHFQFSIKFVFDRLSVPMAILSFVLTGTISAFAARYMHRESGYNRFFFLYAVFVLGMAVTSLANTIETLFAGWELVGLSSILLVVYYQERPGPARKSLWIWVVYRVSDAALLLGAAVLHHLTGEGDFDRVLGSAPWPDGTALLSSTHALVVGLLFLVAAAGKSGLIPIVFGTLFALA